MRVTGGGEKDLVLEFDEDEAGLIRQLTQEMRTLLEAEVPREDPVVARLFPEAYEDPEDERKYQEMTGGELRRDKLRALEDIEQTLGPSGAARVGLTPDAASAWLAWMNDVRLAVGTRLGVSEETMETDPDPESPEAPAYSVLHWLGWIQASIIERLEPIRGMD